MEQYGFTVGNTYYSPPGIEETGGYARCLLCQVKTHWEAGSLLHTKECPRQQEKEQQEKAYQERNHHYHEE